MARSIIFWGEREWKSEYRTIKDQQFCRFCKGLYTSVDYSSSHDHADAEPPFIFISITHLQVLVFIVHTNQTELVDAFPYVRLVNKLKEIITLHAHHVCV